MTTQEPIRVTRRLALGLLGGSAWALMSAREGFAMSDFDPDNPATMSVMPAGWQPGVKCQIVAAGGTRPVVVLWGDSHAIQQLPAIKQHCINTDTNLVAFVGGLCPPYAPAAGDGSPAAVQARNAIEFIEQKVDAGVQRVTVILGGFWEYYRHLPGTDPRYGTAKRFKDGEHSMFTYLASRGVRVCAISAIPTIPLNIDWASAPDTMTRAEMMPYEAITHNWLVNRMNLIPSAKRHIADIKQFLCVGDTCYIRAAPSYPELYFDNVHLNVEYTHRHQSAFRWVVL